MSAEVAFVLCAENNHTGPQALLLARSLREFGGRHRNAKVYAFSPRPEFVPPPTIVAQLRELDVEIITERIVGPINDHPQGNKPLVAGWAERHLPANQIIVMDSDGLILGEPDIDHIDAVPGLTAAWARGFASAGPCDPFDSLWRDLAKEIELPPPTMRTAITGQKTRPYFNSGFVVASRRSGFFGWWECEYQVLASSAPLTRLLRSTSARLGATREVPPLFFLDQISLAIAAWRDGNIFELLGNRYNLPLQYVVAEALSRQDHGRLPPKPVYVQYSEYLQWPYFMELLTRSGWLPASQVDWIRRHREIISNVEQLPWPPSFNVDLERFANAWRRELQDEGKPGAAICGCI